MMTFNVTDRKTFLSLDQRVEKIKELASPNAAIILVATYCDEVGKRTVTPEEGAVYYFRFHNRFRRKQNL